MKSNLYKQRGFTLVEMAIVVVLGGILLAAGLVAGRGLISRSQTQDVLQIVGDLQAASHSFKQRYGYLPGDWVFAANQIPGIAAAPGNGDGLIAGTVPATGLAPAGEARDAASQLYAAGLIGKMGSNVSMRLQSSFGAVHIAEATAANTSVAYGTANPGVRNVILLFNLPCEVVLEVDRALDDANDATGKAMSNVPCVAGNTAARYIAPL
jgi:prepilin-type N-terminal cleavage/methylation domain-containing protein